MIFRATYLREGKERGMTFGKRNEALAADFAYNVLQGFIRRIGGGAITSIKEVKEKRK